jgi:hypothetical protein
MRALWASSMLAAACAFAGCGGGSGGDKGSSFMMPPTEVDDGGGVMLSFSHDAGQETGAGNHADGGAHDAAAGVEAGPPPGPTAFDTAVAIPSHDCRTDAAVNCISYAGTYDGNPIDSFCNMADGTDVTIHAGEWVIGCDTTSLGLARIYIPIQKVGSISGTATAGSASGMDFEFSADSTTSIALFSTSLVHATMVGTIAASSPGRVVTGTFHGQWGTPDSSCSGLYGVPCAAADINVTFREASMYGTCLSDADCTAPATCDSVAYYCHD